MTLEKWAAVSEGLASEAELDSNVEARAINV